MRSTVTSPSGSLSLKTEPPDPMMYMTGASISLNRVHSAILSVDLFGALAKLIGCKTIFRINIKMFHWKKYLYVWSVGRSPPRVQLTLGLRLESLRLRFRSRPHISRALRKLYREGLWIVGV